MIEWINEIFGISNEVSVPTLISIIVFLIGGLVNYLFSKLKEYNLRKSNRETFRHLLKEVCKDLKTKEKNLLKFYPQINLKREETWRFKHRDIIYLETIFEFDFIEIYYSFRKQFSFSLNKKLKSKTFHKIWALLRKYKFYEHKIIQDLDNLTKSHSEQLERYNFNMEKYRELKELNHHKYMVESVSNKEKDIEIKLFLEKENEISYSWADLGEIRTHYFYSYNNLVKPLLELNREQSDLAITLEYGKILVQCELEYQQLESIINSYNHIFKDYYLGYKRDHKLLKKYLELIK
ncbi:hypothetical protein LB450_00915 [Psychroflexus sp. CAK1W]|uniref:hypothetical protein n=1 Tax=Psychroflexus curvus TaxID=2873595 RepID=UPI001CCE2F7E|nr:hypothetical protein [Psychroflexus curvus]MBZ9626650.1 hypothetical protein [Psychroflexus curvus]